MGGRLRAVVLGLAVAACRTSEPGTFEYGERSTGVIEVHLLLGSMPRTIELTVFADGTVIGREITGLDRRVLFEFRDRLAPEQVRGLVADAVRSGLAEFDADSFQKGNRSYTVDGGAVWFRIDLDRLVHADGSVTDPYSSSFVLDDPHNYARQFPARPELAALERICTALAEVHRAHERERRRQRPRPRPG